MVFTKTDASGGFINSSTYESISIITDMFFFMDMVVIFRTAINDGGVVIRSCKAISRRYLKGRFFIDLISTIPFDFVFSPFVSKDLSIKLKLFALAKLLRLSKITHII